MRIQKDQSPQSFSIIGMDFFTSECPDLESFKALLLSENGIFSVPNPFPEEANQPLKASEIKEIEIDDSLSLARYTDVAMKRSFLDAELDIPQAENADFSTVIHLPFNISADHISSELISTTNMKLVSHQIEIIRGDFTNALEQSVFQLQNTSCEFVALISFFAYSQPEKDDSGAKSIDSDLGIDQNTSLGLGCLLLSRQNSSNRTYASIVWDNPQDHSDKTNSQKAENLSKNRDENAQFIKYPYFHFAPISNVIKSALEINSQTHFPDPQFNCADNINSGENTQHLISPWFPLPYTEKREIAAQLKESNNQHPPIQLEKDYFSVHHTDHPFSNFQYFLLPVTINDAQHGTQTIENLKKKILECENLSEFIDQSLIEHENRDSSTHTLVVLGASKQELINELERAHSGIMNSFETGKDWQTPAGSYFTPKPFGSDAKIAFVYPGAFGTYIGMGREIFCLFPQLYDTMQSITSDPSAAINESVIFPTQLFPGEGEQLQTELNRNPIKMISSGVCFSYLYTVILRDIFKVEPNTAFGYCLGENSMMFAMGIWTQADGMRTSLEVSPIFHTRVSGAQNAIREFWKISSAGGKKEEPSIWANYVLMASFEKVKSAISDNDRVYITHINTPRQVVIGGEKDACRRVAEAVKCMHLQAPYHHAIHCPPVVSEYDGFVHLHDWPVENNPDFSIYSAANYAALEYDSKFIANSFARMLTNPIDFPRLVNLAYEDGARIFIELGAGSNCSKWISANLNEKPHVSVSINQNNVGDHVSILKLIARLISHHVSVNLNPLRRI